MVTLLNEARKVVQEKKRTESRFSRKRDTHAVKPSCGVNEIKNSVNCTSANEGCPHSFSNEASDAAQLNEFGPAQVNLINI